MTITRATALVAAALLAVVAAPARAQDSRAGTPGCQCSCGRGQADAGTHAGMPHQGQAGCPCGGGHGQPAGGGQAGQGMKGGMDASHAADMELFHFLADHGQEIRRTIKVIPTGVDTLTESDNPEVAEKIRQHVASMSARVAEQRPIHMRDPLFAEIFRHAKQITVTHDATDKGVRVVETSDDPYVAKLIQAHAEVVSLFIKNGRAEMMKNHEVPAP